MSRRRTERRHRSPRITVSAPGSSATPVAATSAEPEALVITRTLEPGEVGEPHSATVRFTGRRVGVRGKPNFRDTFVRDEVIESVVPGAGPVSISTWVYGLDPAEWLVDAEVVGDRPHGSASVSRGRGRQVLSDARWSWRRWSLATAAPAPIRTRWALAAPLAAIPAVVPGSYPILAAVGAAIALTLQSILVGTEGISSTSVLAVTAIALLTGLLAAKAWYAALRPDESIVRGGWAVDGFLVVAPIVIVAGLVALDLPIGAVLDASAPGLFLAIAVGRIGCFLTGCCAGRMSNSRWAVWSSDRRIGARRLPAQLIESLAGAVLAVVSLVLVVGLTPPVHGLVFVTTSGAYAVVRQALLRIRAERRRSYWTLPLTAAAAAIVLLVVAAASLGQPDHMPPGVADSAGGATGSVERSTTTPSSGSKVAVDEHPDRTRGEHSRI